MKKDLKYGAFIFKQVHIINEPDLVFTTAAPRVMLPEIVRSSGLRNSVD